MSKNRTNIPAGTEWDAIVGYSRAVKSGNIIEVAGTASVDNGKVIGAGDPYEQTLFVLRKIEQALKELGAGMQDVVRTGIYVKDITRWEEVGKAHGEFFKEIKPATTMVEVSGFIDPELLVEIEVTAVVGD